MVLVGILKTFFQFFCKFKEKFNAEQVHDFLNFLKINRKSLINRSFF